jgi:nucleoid DNA-binding protein
MNKGEIIRVVSNKLQNNLSKKEVGDVIDIFIETIKETLQNKDKVILKGFITFKTRLSSAKSGESFGKKWSIGSRQIPKVSFSPSFKKSIN